jgi:hypothetical protein
LHKVTNGQLRTYPVVSFINFVEIRFGRKNYLVMPIFSHIDT